MLIIFYHWCVLNAWSVRGFRTDFFYRYRGYWISWRFVYFIFCFVLFFIKHRRLLLLGGGLFAFRDIQMVAAIEEGCTIGNEFYRSIVTRGVPNFAAETQRYIWYTTLVAVPDHIVFNWNKCIIVMKLLSISSVNIFNF